MTTWYDAQEGIVETANQAMAKLSRAIDDRAQRLQDIWMPVATALLNCVREELDRDWPDEAALAKSLGPDFVGQTSDTGKVVSWGEDHGDWREFRIHELEAADASHS